MLHKNGYFFVYLFNINSDSATFALEWNLHKLRSRGRAVQLPAAMWGFDQFVLGMRCPAPQPLNLNNADGENLDMFSVNWDELHNNNLIASYMENNNGNEGLGVSWLGCQGPPPNLVYVQVDAPNAPLDVVGINNRY